MSLLAIVAILLALWAIGTVVYRLFFHPLASFPGPKLAIATYCYEWYYDLIRGGQYTFKLKELHERYGKSTQPKVLHFNDPDYYDEIFNITNGKTEKPYKAANTFGPYPAAIGTVDHDLHRVRRGALNPFFSKRSVVEILPFVQNIIEKLCHRFDAASRTGEPTNLKYSYAALTLDIMNEYCFSTDPQNIMKSDYGRKSLDDVDSFLAISLVNTHIPWLMRVMYSLPDWFSRIINPAMVDILELREGLAKQVEDIRHGNDLSYEQSGHRTIFHSLLESKLPFPEMKRDRLRDEAFSLITAGSITTAHVLRAVSYHIAADPAVRQKLFQELRTVMPKRADRPKLQDLERLPYLTAVIREGLRINNPVTHRQCRAFPDKALRYNGLTVPPGTLIHVTALLIHENERIFPEPRAFKPERWLGPIEQQPQRYLVPFVRGTRACLGINLAWAELYLILATVFRRFDFDISSVIRERDIDVAADMIIGVPASDSQGIIVKVLATQD
ncbi:cytochrome p450 [Lasallia pustulata]|uniref:Cytochrome p450 n=1 Tax=Lasallia pustulata TaxID=136370 RepID=A0A1W5CWN9_9LECA|nr:cytochrome p450 [Lasallia pustulata]